MGIPVIATERGFYDQLREPDEPFEIRSEKDMGSWMQRVNKKDAQAPTATGQQSAQGKREQGAQRNGAPAAGDNALV